MLKLMLYLYFSITFIITPIDCIDVNIQKEILKSFNKDLSIKNIIIVTQVKSKNDLLFAKYFSKLNIYTSFLNVKKLNNLLEKYNNECIYFVKTIVLIDDEYLSIAIPQIFKMKNEHAVSKFIWISFNKDFFKEIKFYVPYNTQLLIFENYTEYYKISEIYHPSIDKQNYFDRHIGFWDKSIGIGIYEKDLYQRRFNMNKTILTLVYQRGDKRYTWLEFIGVIIRMMNFRVHIRSAQEYEKGASYRGKLLHPEVILKPMVFDYTTDYYPFILGLMWKLEAFLFIKYDSIYEQRDISLYLRPFSIQLWYSVFISILISAICSLIIIFIKRKLKNFQNIGFINSLYHSIEAFANQYGGEKPITISMRIVVITIRLVALFIVPAYSAAILTFILVPNIQLPFTDIKGFVQDGSYKLGFSTHEQYYLWFKHTNDPWLKIAKEKFLINQEDMPKNFWEEFKKLCEYKKIAFIFFGDMAVAAPCRVIKIPTPITTVWTGLYLRENSPYTKIFNRILKNILSSGVFQKTIEEIPRYVEEFEREAIIEENTVAIETTAPILKLFSILYSIAGLLLILELILHKIILRYRRRL